MPIFAEFSIRAILKLGHTNNRIVNSQNVTSKRKKCLNTSKSIFIICNNLSLVNKLLLKARTNKLFFRHKNQLKKLLEKTINTNKGCY